MKRGDSTLEHARIGNYELLLDVGRGGMGSVHLARALSDAAGAGFERLVAVKRALPSTSADAESLQRFLEEARLAARVHHANVVGIHLVGQDDDGPFMVLDYIEGATLDVLVDHAALKRGRLPPPIVLRILSDALSGLDAVHETTDAEGVPLGILHRDVAPQNLIVGVDGVTRLADFGIAKGRTSSVDTGEAFLQGRLAFLAPEYLARRPVDRRIDVYAMGLTAWCALTGDLPWPGASEAQLVLHAVNDGVPSLSSTGLAIAPAIERVVAAACARSPEDRFASAAAMLSAVEELGRHTGWIATHAEVAAQVRAYVGPDLAARRARVAALGRSRAASANRAPRAADSDAEIDRPGSSSALRTSTFPLSRRQAARGAALAAFVLLGAAALLLRASRSRRGASDAPSEPAQIIATSERVDASGLIATQPIDAPSASANATPEPSASASSTNGVKADPGARAASTRSTAAPPRRRNPTALPIATTNPYR